MATTGIDPLTGQIAIYMSPQEAREASMQLMEVGAEYGGWSWVLGSMLHDTLSGETGDAPASPAEP